MKNISPVHRACCTSFFLCVPALLQNLKAAHSELKSMVLSWVPVAPHSKLSEKYYCIFFHNSITPDVLWKPKPSQSILALPLCQHFFWLADEWVLSFFQFYTPLASICARITRQNVSSEGSLIVALARPTLFEALLFSSIHSVHSKLFSVAKTFSPIICEGNFSCKNIVFPFMGSADQTEQRPRKFTSAYPETSLSRLSFKVRFIMLI